MSQQGKKYNRKPMIIAVIVLVIILITRLILVNIGYATPTNNLILTVIGFGFIVWAFITARK